MPGEVGKAVQRNIESLISKNEKTEGISSKDVGDLETLLKSKPDEFYSAEIETLKKPTDGPLGGVIDVLESVLGEDSIDASVKKRDEMLLNYISTLMQTISKGDGKISSDDFQALIEKAGSAKKLEPADIKKVIEEISTQLETDMKKMTKELEETEKYLTDGLKDGAKQLKADAAAGMKTDLSKYAQISEYAQSITGQIVKDVVSISEANEAKGDPKGKGTEWHVEQFYKIKNAHKPFFEALDKANNALNKANKAIK